ncbi:hypothetical protein HK100_004892 [Physocladia obscura]|uniref:Uncharacterized protein n=1 Tax=Physocladia obscura TaxID=109957 RepID=A0AAD5ST94_9FUNG|nr:hypothetical protein HK100_004892 [Physocladia obscura]
MEQFLGATISLISKSDIRYIGVLHSINQQESTVALENVKSLGTEGRKGNSADEIMGSPQIFEFIVFRGSDIKDLQVLTAPPAKTSKPAQPQAAEPSISAPPISAPTVVAKLADSTVRTGIAVPAVPAVSKPSEVQKLPSQVPTGQQQQQPRQNSSHANLDEEAEKLANLSINQSKSHENGNASTRDNNSNNSNNNNHREARGGRGSGSGGGGGSRGYHSNGTGNRGSHQQSQRGRAPAIPFSVPSADFDFELMNSKFNKGEVVTIRPDETADSPDTESRAATLSDDKFYDKKSSFFDNISCEARDRAEGERRVVRGPQERKLNLETFGQTTIDSNRNNYRRGGGRGRGGRSYYPNNGGNSSRGGNGGSRGRGQNLQPTGSSSVSC